jgi:RHS repeat-associated protein
VLRQLLAATLCAVLVAPAYPSESTLPRTSSTPSHIYDAATLSKTRVWGSSEKILLHFRAVLLLSEKQHWGSAKCSCKNVVGSLVTYDYDAFGNLIHSTGTTPNNYLFAAEQYDPDLGLYYNRARYLNTSTGRFWTMDTEEGDEEKDPLSLQKYLFTKADPVDGIDPSGNDSIDMTLDSMSVLRVSQCMKGGSAEPRVATAQSDQGITFLKIHEGYRISSLLRGRV